MSVRADRASCAGPRDWWAVPGVPATARCGGTSTAGNAIGDGLVLDLSRHMNRVLAVDTEGASGGSSPTATAEAGVVLTELRAAVHAATDHRLTFAPDPSSQSRACVGGAIGNDACGNHSVRHGRTADHVEALQLVTADGLRLFGFRTSDKIQKSFYTMGLIGLEPMTLRLSSACSNQLSYRPV